MMINIAVSKTIQKFNFYLPEMCPVISAFNKSNASDSLRFLPCRI